MNLAGDSDGVDTAHKMQADHPVQVVFMTAHGDCMTRTRAAAVHPAGFLPKPFSPEELLTAVTAAGFSR